MAVGSRPEAEVSRCQIAARQRAAQLRNLPDSDVADGVGDALRGASRSAAEHDAAMDRSSRQDQSRGRGDTN